MIHIDMNDTYKNNKMSYYQDHEEDDIKVVQYTKEYTMRVLGMTEEDIRKYGCPSALKYDGCDVVIPIPSIKSVRSNMRKIVKTESTTNDEKDLNKLAKIVSTKLAKEFFL